MTTLLEETELDDELEALPHGDRLRLMQISRATDLWLGELERKNHSERTINTYRRLLDKLADHLPPGTDVDDVRRDNIRRFLDEQARRRDGQRKAAATVAQNVSIVCGFFDWLKSEGVTKRNPTRHNDMRAISRPAQVRPEDNDNVISVSTTDVLKLLAAADRMGWNRRLAVNVAVYLGPRRAAISRARISDYDAADRKLTFREKGRKTIRKPVPHPLADLIDAAIHAGVYTSMDDYLVPGDDKQRRPGDRDDRVIWRLIRDVAQEAGVTTHVHALRAAFAVNYLEQNPGNVVALQTLMGHLRPETTNVYLRRLDRQQSMETVRELTWGVEEEVPAE